MKLRVVLYCLCVLVLTSCFGKKNIVDKKKNPGVVLIEPKPVKLPSVKEDKHVKKLKKANKKLGQKAWSNNIGDYNNHIFVGTNQNSYKGKMLVTRGKDKGKLRDYTPNLPTYYSKSNVKKICLSYFITILYDKDTLEILVMSIVCMPNGELESNYKNRVLQAGKNLDKTRFRFSEVPDFELLEGKPKRIKVVYFDEKMDIAYKNKLSFFEDLYAQNE